MMVWEFIAWGYLCGVTLVILRQIAFSLFEMDQFAWESIDRLEFFGFFTISAVFWPLICLKRPSSLFNPALLFEMELNRANEARTRFELENRPPYCSAWASLRHTPNAGLVPFPVDFTFPSEDIEKVLLEGGWFGPLQGRDHKALLHWVELAVLSDPTKSDVPPVWQNAFNIVADELIHRGVGECYCPQCERTYSNKLLVPSAGSTGFGWIQNRFSCPEGHLVMSYDFIKVFCGTGKSSKSDDVAV